VSYSKPRYRFARFTLSPSRRLLLRDGEELPLIPRYFDLLVLLVGRRGEAVSRREILDAAWSDVVVTDNALNQAVRILRRTLDDDSRNPAFIRTVSRHGYRFVWSEVVEESDEGPLPTAAKSGYLAEPEPSAPGEDEPEDAFEPLLRELTLETSDGDEESDRRREAAERLHVLGTREALRRLDRQSGHPRARALLRDTRWDVHGAAPVPILGQPAPVRTTVELARLRLRRALRLAGKRWLAAATGGAAAGVLAGLLGALVLRFGPGSSATHALFVALPLVGGIAGGLGAIGVGAGLAVAEAVIRSSRGLALVLMGGAGGLAVGVLTNLVARLAFEGLFGRDPSVLAGGFEGMVIGSAAGLGYAISTPTREGGMATPRGMARIRVLLITGAACAIAAALLGAAGSYLGGMSLDFVARSFPASQVTLDPLARILGEPAPGPVTRTLISAWEGLFFGCGLALGMTRRPH
jgi:DNA-binding winged helix-turn-helix (wHTH) protein